MYIDFPLDGNTLNPTLKSLKRSPTFSPPSRGPSGGVLEGLEGPPKSSEELPSRRLEGPEDPWKPLEAPKTPWRPSPSSYSFQEARKREDDLFEVGIEGVALNPNRK